MDVAMPAPSLCPSPSTACKEAPNYQIIVPQFLKGAVVPFLGAGASIFHRKLLNGAACPPSSAELAEHLAITAQLNADIEDTGQIRTDLPLVASYFEHVELDRDGLRDELKTVFDKDFAAEPAAHAAGPRRRQQPMLIITTNYDDMIERAFQDAKVPYHLVVTAIEDLQVKFQEPGGNQLSPVDPQTLKISLKTPRSSTRCMAVSIGRATSRATTTSSSPRRIMWRSSAACWSRQRSRHCS